MPEWLRKILEEPTASVPDAGRCLGIGRNQAYEAAVRGQIKTIRIGRSLRVPTSWLRRTLLLDEPGEAGRLEEVKKLPAARREQLAAEAGAK